MTTAQPGQEQRMVTDAMIEAGCAAMRKMSDEMLARERSKTPQDMPDYDEGDLCRVIFLAMHAARPTADLGEDGKLVERLRDEATALERAAWSRPDGGQDGCIAANLANEAADRIELYREALELIAEGKGGKADCIRRFAKAALSRSGG